MEVPFFEWLVQQTGPTVVAILALWYQQQNHRAYVARERENADTHRGDKILMVDAIREATAAQVTLNLTVAQLGHVMDRFTHVDRQRLSSEER